MLPVFRISVYLVAFVSSVVWFMVRMLPLMDVVMGMSVFVPMVLYSSIHMVPAFIGSLKVTVITLFRATLTALFAGSVLVIVGAVPSVLVVK